jgi:hypothetical protein
VVRESGLVGTRERVVGVGIGGDLEMESNVIGDMKNSLRLT